jgi:starch synthase (maltosyl-transferring)
VPPKRPPQPKKSTAIPPGQLPHIVIENVSPELDAGRYPVKRTLGAMCEIGADIFKEGHDQLAARVRYRGPGEEVWRVIVLTYDKDEDRWFASFPLDRIGRWSFIVEAWTDVFRTWRSGLDKKVAAGQDVHVELMEGALLVSAAARRMRFGDQRTDMLNRAATMRDETVAMTERSQLALEPELLAFMEANYAPQDVTCYSRTLSITVERERAAFAAWYELFPRSESEEPGVHGTFRSAERRLPQIADLGFDVLYLPPIHPIGTTFRKGRNNTLTPTPDDVGSPWAIGGPEGGHDAVHPQLGTVADFEHFVERATQLGMEVALDYALQCSPDHPWVKEHPDWFHIRPDGTIQYAENPPKKYQDIYPINFWCDDRDNLWNACRNVMRFWIDCGVRTFRVDNPHTKPFAFWEWLIAEIQREHPDVVFLAEAFTRPKKLLNLAKLGFSQSYTYFTWKNTAVELIEFLTEFSRSEVLEYYRGNLFTNTPDILHEYLQTGGPPAFSVRLLLAATLSPLYGIYSGFELFEGEAVKPGSEEYLDSEKYQLRTRDYDSPRSLNPEIRTINRIRRENPALQRADNLTFHRSDNPNILFYHKAAPTGAGDLLIAVNLDPLRAQESMVHVPLDDLGLDPYTPFGVTDLLTGARYTWSGVRNYVRLVPGVAAGHVLRVDRPAAAPAVRP